MELTENLKKLPPIYERLDIFESDDCCGKALSKALASVTLAEKTEWTHEKCGCRWRVQKMHDGSRYWYPVVEVWIW